MISKKITPEELWARQGITSLDVDYHYWDRKRELVQQMSRVSQSCLFVVDVFKKRYDFASENFSRLFGYAPEWIEAIREQGDWLEERIHPDDRKQLVEYQVDHGQFIYSLPVGCRNDYQQVFQFRVLNTCGEYVNVVSRHQVFQTDKNGRAWMIMGVMDISPDQVPGERVKRTVVNRKTGEIVKSATCLSMVKPLTDREKEVLLLIRQGFLSKEIADKLQVSIYTVNNHRKSILAKLQVDNAIEAINLANDSGILF
ncbi:LuxR C-terminal-related transcriptional regulator [Odoribacter sp. AF15-53]|uniref:LuxR C-terminal-related transcriptional regulator n=1 Tax=Odoribacter sp. AF15-53 TaxID=2292236 RepID=UPI000E4FAC18|nr:LuxR C-terminal-related transcriptional regulator [Odoribacter sp. AF15-53]RHR83111.1 DNA-binding response regulator [Odoribacter sp. AF15-53]